MKIKFGTALLLLLSYLVLSPGEARASHLKGCDISYECISACVIEVNLVCYRDCSGIPGVSAGPFSFVSQTPGCGMPTPVTNPGGGGTGWSPPVVTEVTPLCPGATTLCSGGTSSSGIDGVQEYAYSRRYDICSVPNCVYLLTYNNCCRNPSITNISNPGNTSIYIGTTTLNTGIIPCNNSPYFTSPPVPYICQGLPFTYNQGAVDPDGDSLRFSLGPCFDGPNAPVNYLAGYSPAQPLGPDWNVILDPVTGDLTVLPQPGSAQTAVICIYVEEYRNGVLINTIVRDAQMTVINCGANTPPTCGGIQAVIGGSGGTGSNPPQPWEVTVCAGTPLSFGIQTYDPDPLQIQTLSWDMSLAGQGATFGNGAQMDSIVGNQPYGTFNWTPQQGGTYLVTFTVADNHCPIFGINQYTVQIIVTDTLPGAFMTATPTGCTNVQLNANPGTGGTGPYTYQWWGDGNLNQNPNNTQQNLNHTYPGPGSYEVNVAIMDSLGCTTVLTDTVLIQQGPTADAGPDITVCSGFPVQLGAPQIGGQTYLWAPSINLSDPTLAQPVFQYTNTSATPDTFMYTLAATQGFCTALDYVTVIVMPTPVVTTNGNQQICLGDAATLTASGGTNYTWSTQETTASISVSPTTTTTYTVTTTENGCTSPPVSVTVTVVEGPTAIVTGTDSVCSGDAATLTATGGTSWLWSTGATTQTITVSNITQDTTVSVVASLNGCPGPSVDYTIVVHESPVTAFAASTNCFSTATQFTDASTLVNGQIVGWAWNFGDPVTGTSNTSTAQNPGHTFSAPGNYLVSLTVTGSNGCQTELTQSVTVNPLPNPDFVFTKACEGSAIQFTDQSSSGAGITAWNWNFGDGNFSNQQNPSHLYAAAGPYNVTLVVTDGNGCSKESIKTVFVYPNATAGFTYQLSCFNSVADFTSTSSLIDPYGTTLDLHEWNFGDPGSGASNTSTDVNPTHVFNSPGTYTVTLTVVTSQGCETVEVQQITIPATPLLLVENDSVCQGSAGMPMVVGNVQPNTTIGWFYNQQSSQPFAYGMSYVTPPLNFTQVYYVAMIDAAGCISPMTPVFVIVDANPSLTIDISERELEIPNAITEFVVSNIGNGPIVSYDWSFGDGSTSGMASPVHQYTEEGDFDISLTVTDAGGCETTYEMPDWIEVTKQVAMYIPNAFSPNADGVNDVFFVQPKLIRSLDIEIYDRWGRMVYQSSDINFTWNGDDGSGQSYQEGVYTYRVRATAFDGEIVKQVGTVTLIR